MIFDKFFLIDDNTRKLCERKCFLLEDYYSSNMRWFGENLDPYIGIIFENFFSTTSPRPAILFCLKQSDKKQTCQLFLEINRVIRGDDISSWTETCFFDIFNCMIKNKIQSLDHVSLRFLLDYLQKNRGRPSEEHSVHVEKLESLMIDMFGDNGDDLTVNFSR